MKRFKDTFIDKDERFSIGIDLSSGENYVSIPVSNRMVDYEEYYVIPKDLANNYDSNRDSILEIVRKCRAREYDDYLIIQPGSDRGIPT